MTLLQWKATQRKMHGKIDFVSVSTTTKTTKETKSDTKLSGQGSGVNLGEEGGGVNVTKTHWKKFSKN